MGKENTTKKNGTQRIPWLDTAKAIGIYLVILGHLNMPQTAFNVIYSFHMPLFFFLAGLTFNKTESLNIFLKKKTLRLVVPYFFFSAILFAFWFFIRRNADLSSSVAGSTVDVLLQILYGINTSTYTTPLWFLTALFMTEMLFYLIVKQKKKPLIIIEVIVFWFIGECYYQLNQLNLAPRIFWNIDFVPTYLFFLAMGFFAKEKVKEMEVNFSNEKKLIAIFVAMAIFSTAFYLDNYSLVATCAGIFCTIFISHLLPTNRLCSFIGQNTMTFFALHLMVISCLRGVLVYVSHENLHTIQNTLWLNLVISFLCPILLIPVAIFLRRFTPWAIGGGLPHARVR